MKAVTPLLTRREHGPQTTRPLCLYLVISPLLVPMGIRSSANLQPASAQAATGREAGISAQLFVAQIRSLNGRLAGCLLGSPRSALVSLGKNDATDQPFEVMSMSRKVGGENLEDLLKGRMALPLVSEHRTGAHKHKRA